jgi:hypothetical protein
MHENRGKQGKSLLLAAIILMLLAGVSKPAESLSTSSLRTEQLRQRTGPVFEADYTEAEKGLVALANSLREWQRLNNAPALQLFKAPSKIISLALGVVPPVGSGAAITLGKSAFGYASKPTDTMFEGAWERAYINVGIRKAVTALDSLVSKGLLSSESDISAASAFLFGPTGALRDIDPNLQNFVADYLQSMQTKSVSEFITSSKKAYGTPRPEKDDEAIAQYPVVAEVLDTPAISDESAVNGSDAILENLELVENMKVLSGGLGSLQSAIGEDI